MRHFKLYILAALLTLVGCGGGTEKPLDRDLFDDVCSVTDLPCSKITISYKDLPNDTEAEAYLTNQGNMGVWFNDDKQNLSATKMAGLSAHELAHLIVFQTNPDNGTHNAEFQEVCKNLARLVDVNVGEYCEV